MKLDAPYHIGTILRRYKRFFADIKLESGEEIIAHVPNTGRMTSCLEPGWKCLVTQNDDPKRKLKYTLELTHNGSTWIGVNTNRTNKIVYEALTKGSIPEFKNTGIIKKEVTIGDSRIDFCLEEANKKIFIEVKNVTLKEDNNYLFPDAVSTRGQKHLRELINIAQMKNHQAYMLYLIQREDANIFSAAKDVDPEYAKLLKEAQKNGVKILAYQCKISPSELSVDKKVKVNI